MYVNRSDKYYLIVIAIYVDDLFIAASKGSDIVRMKKMLDDRIEMKAVVEAKLCLGLETLRDLGKRSLFLSKM